MSLELEIELTRGAPAATLDVLVLILAVRGGLTRDVGQMGHEIGQIGLNLSTTLGKTVDFLVDLAHGLLGGFGLVLLALLHQGADLLGLGVARSLELLNFDDDLTTLIIHLKELLTVPRSLAIGHGLVDSVGILSNEFDIEHASSVVPRRRRAGTAMCIQVGNIPLLSQVYTYGQFDLTPRR